jgi:PAS domain-containing protein
VDDEETGNLREAERALQELAAVFLQRQSVVANSALDIAESQNSAKNVEMPLLNMEAKYRALVEQIPAVVFMAYLDEGIGEAYVSPQIKAALGFSQDEWLEDPVVSADTPRRQDEVERGGGRNVSFGEAAAVHLSGDCAGWENAVVSMRSENDSP